MRRDQVLPGSVSSSVRGLLPEAQNLEGKIFEKKNNVGANDYQIHPICSIFKRKMFN